MDKKKFRDLAVVLIRDIGAILIVIQVVLLLSIGIKSAWVYLCGL